MKLKQFLCLARKVNFQKLAENETEEVDIAKLILKLSAATHIFTPHACARPRTYVLWDLDEGKGILGGLCWQGPGAEGRGDGSQTSGRHNFSLREDERRTEIRPNIEHFSRQSSWCFIYAIMHRHTVAFVFLYYQYEVQIL